MGPDGSAVNDTAARQSQLHCEVIVLVAEAEHPAASVTVNERIPGREVQKTVTSEPVELLEMVPAPPVIVHKAVWPAERATELLVLPPGSDVVHDVVLPSTTGNGSVGMVIVG